VRKEFRQGIFNGVVGRFDPKTGWYQVTYEDGDFEELSEDETFVAARAFRDYRRHRDASGSGTSVRVVVPRMTSVHPNPEDVKPSVHTIPADASASSVVVEYPVSETSLVLKEKLATRCKTLVFLWGSVHIAYTFFAWLVGKII
jgi:hypothetical protein